MNLTFTSCSSLHVFTPWCPTKIDNVTNEIIEWDECLDDCPHQKPEIVCLEDPEFPSYVDGEGQEANFTSDYEPDVGLIMKEFDIATFTCPLGYVFNGTFNVSVNAICYDWEWMPMYDPDTFCVRK